MHKGLVPPAMRASGIGCTKFLQFVGSMVLSLSSELVEMFSFSEGRKQHAGERESVFPQDLAPAYIAIGEKPHVSYNSDKP